jgi:hypothetical protein
MSECANCYKSVYVPDGYEFEEGDMCMSCTKQELDSSWKLVDRLGKLLHDTANVLHGGPKENGLWSYHNVPELAEELTAKADRLQTLVSSADDRDGCMMWTSDHDKILSRFKEENNKLRGLLAAGKGDCVYCGLPAADIAKCPHGFPGCARMDDIVNKHETAVEMENTNLRVDVLNLRDALKSLTDKLEANDGRKPEPAE